MKNTEKSLLKAFTRRRDEASFRQLYRKLTPALFALALRLCGSRSEAEELTQEAWVRAVERHDRFAGKSRYSTWLTAILINCFRESARRVARQPRSLDENPMHEVAAVVAAFPRPGNLPADPLDVERALSLLPAGYREVVVLHDVNGHTHAEIAEFLGIAEGTSKSQLARGREKMRELLGRRVAPRKRSKRARKHVNRKSADRVWPPDASDGETLATKMEPPDMLEDRVVDALHARGLLAPGRSALETHPGWRIMRASLAAAACAGLLVIGVWLGRSTGVAPPASPLRGAQADLYALLLYETEGYDRPAGAQARARYSEYSAWVATAVRRGQFVTGEDFAVDRGWLLVPTEEGSEVRAATSVAADTPLSGIFFVRARDEAHALELARELPHIRHGGSVLVQKTIPTDTPPD